MQIETIGKYQVHLIAHELADGEHWDPFVEVYRFDDEARDFLRVVEKRRAADTPLDSYEKAIAVARNVGAALIKSGDV